MKILKKSGLLKTFLLFLVLIFCVSLVSAKNITYDFEDGTQQGWIDDTSEFQVFSNPSRGSFSAGADSDNLPINIAHVNPSNISGGKKIDYFEHYYYEQGPSNGGGIRLRDNTSSVVIGVAANNPGWVVDDNNGINTLNASPDSDVSSWYRVKIIFNWSDGTADIEWEDITQGKSVTYENRVLKQNTNIESVHLDNFLSTTSGWSSDTNNFYHYIDNVLIEYQPNLEFNKILANFSGDGYTEDWNNTGSNTSDINFQTNVTTEANHSYSLDGGLFQQYGTNTTLGNLSISPSEGFHNISFLVETDGINETRFYDFFIDLTNPSLTDNLPAELNGFQFNTSDYITFSDNIEVDSCIANYTLNATENILVNCSDQFLFTDNGDWDYEIIVNDTVGRENTSTGTMTVDATPPNLDENIPAEINSSDYSINLTQYINFSNSTARQVDTCQVEFTYQEGDETQTTLCNNSNFVFNYNGNWDYNITVNDTAGLKNTSLGSILVNPIQVFNFKTPASNPITNFTFNGKFFENQAEFEIFDLTSPTSTPENVTLLFEKKGYESTNITVLLTNTSGIDEVYNISLSRIMVDIFNRNTKELLNGTNVTLTLIGDTAKKVVTSTGHYNFTDINREPGQYHIVANAEGFSDGLNYFDFSNQEIVEVDIYLLNRSLSNFGSITIVVKGTTGGFVQGAICDAREFNPNTSQYESIAEDLSNSQGECFFDIELGEKEYIFTASKSGFFGQTEAEIIDVDLSSRTIQLVQPSKIAYEIEGLSGSLTDNVTGNISNITFSYTDSKNRVEQGCIVFYKELTYEEKVLKETCLNQSSGTITESVLINNSYSLNVKGTVEIKDTIYTLDTLRYSSRFSLENVLVIFGVLFLVPILIWILAVSIGVGSGNIMAFLVAYVIGAWGAYLAFPAIMPAWAATFITLICFLMGYGGNQPGK